MTEYGGSPDRDPDRLVRDYADLVMRVCYTYLRSTADAEDVCQDTLVKLVFRAEPFRDLGHERAWVVRVAINACKNLLRDRGAHPTAALDAVPEPAAEPTPDEGALLAREGEVLAAVMALPLPQREAVYLHYYEGYQTDEIAAMLDRPPSTMRNQLRDARAKLKLTLGGEGA